MAEILIGMVLMAYFNEHLKQDIRPSTVFTTLNLFCRSGNPGYNTHIINSYTGFLGSNKDIQYIKTAFVTLRIFKCYRKISRTYENVEHQLAYQPY